MLVLRYNAIVHTVLHVSRKFKTKTGPNPNPSGPLPFAMTDFFTWAGLNYRSTSSFKPNDAITRRNANNS